MQRKLELVLLAVLAASITLYDFYDVIKNGVDLTQHVPFFLPVVLVMLMAIIVVINKHASRT